jgi:ketosteroid isomerase-like protein
MSKLFALRKIMLLLSLLAVPIARVDGQSPQSTIPSNELFLRIASLDGALFDAYNRCDLEMFGTFFIDDVEFYHDQGGVTLGRQNLTESVKKNICGKVRRELVPGRLEVYPMQGYGAVAIGVHRFHAAKMKQSEPTGEAKFVHLWQNKDGAWKITRVISYDHRALSK